MQTPFQLFYFPTVVHSLALFNAVSYSSVMASPIGCRAGFLEKVGANLRQQSLGWQCTPSHAGTRGSGGMPPPRKILKNRC